jgi:hypothetical protein
MSGYPVRIQHVQRAGTSSYYINLPVAVAEVIQAKKSEQWEWLLEDKNTLVFTRAKPLANRKLNSIPRA